MENNHSYLLSTEITKSHLSNRICQHCGVKTSTVTPSFYYVFNMSLSCNINIPSFIGNLWWVLLLGNHLKWLAKCLTRSTCITTIVLELEKWASCIQWYYLQRNVNHSPRSLWWQMLNLGHESHLGTIKCKQEPQRACNRALKITVTHTVLLWAMRNTKEKM